jgi:proline dehydrogenase
MAERFIAGDTLAEALVVAKRINSEKISVTLDHLGENVTSLEEALISRDVYLRALTEICAGGINSNVSIKLTQFGADLSGEACRENVERLAAKASELGNFVRVDMESSAYTERTLALVGELNARYGCVGAVIQAYLFRSEKDVENLCRQRIRVRLCKGAYLEPKEIAFEKKADVDANYLRLMNFLLENGVYPAIATHDEKIIGAAKDFVRRKGISRDAFEFQMLYGIRRDVQKQLVAEGYRLRLYVPFGKAWFPYFMRRLAERPANLMFLARNVLQG